MSDDTRVRRRRRLPTRGELRDWRAFTETTESLRAELAARLQNETGLSPSDYSVLLALSDEGLRHATAASGQDLSSAVTATLDQPGIGDGIVHLDRYYRFGPETGIGAGGRPPPRGARAPARGAPRGGRPRPPPRRRRRGRRRPWSASGSTRRAHGGRRSCSWPTTTTRWSRSPRIRSTGAPTSSTSAWR
jgi:hypothetical protein